MPERNPLNDRLLAPDSCLLTPPFHITAVIPHWNRRDLLEQLLLNLRQQTRLFDSVIVVDNGSTDGSAELAEQLGSRVLRLGSNLGFAVAVNRGIASVGKEQPGEPQRLVAILNNDVTLDPGWLAALMNVLVDSSHSFATGKILSATDFAKGVRTIDGTWDEISRAACSLRCGVGQPDGPAWDQSRSIHMASMTAVLLRRSLFDEVGSLDERFGSYLEDVDFGIRCALIGCSGAYVPEAVALHAGSATLGKWNPDTVRLIARNQVLLAAKHFRPSGISVVRLLWGQGLWGVIALKHGCGLAYLQGKLQGLRLAGAIPRTQTEQQARRFADFVAISERTIFEIQMRSQPDAYWKAYFWLGVAK
ncbi:MAG: glycosyltransferase family 2 protein [Acidobacteriota bacterium]